VRFLVAGTAEATDRARAPVRWFLVFALLLLVALVVQRSAAGGLSGPGVEAHYLGEGGLEPLAGVALWEEVHATAFVYGFLLFVLGSIHAVAPLAPRVRTLLLAATGAAALADLFVPFLVVAGRGLGWLRVGTFCAAVGLLAACTIVALLRFGRPAPSRRPAGREVREVPDAR
jgi:hypothetical protein